MTAECATPLVPKIYIYTCLSGPTRKPIAIIDGVPTLFKADTPMKAKRKAEEFLREAFKVDKLLTKKKRADLLATLDP